MAATSPLLRRLEALDRGQLADLLSRRPPYLNGFQVRSLDSLASVLQEPHSLAQILNELPLPALEVLEAVTALGHFAPIDMLVELLEPTGDAREHRANVVKVLDLLAANALVWSDDDIHLQTTSGLRTLLPSPLGLGRPAEQVWSGWNVDQVKRVLQHVGLPRTGSRVQVEATLRSFYCDLPLIREVIATAPAAVRREIEAIAAGTQQGTAGYRTGRYELLQEVRSWASARGLLFSSYYDADTMPAQVRLSLRDPGYRAPFHPLPPTVPVVPAPPGQVAGEAGAAAADFLGASAAVLDQLGRAPAQRLKAGGLGVREIAKLAKAARAEISQVQTVVAAARSIGLLSEVGGEVTTSPDYEKWTTLEPPVRFEDLLIAWWGLSYCPSLISPSKDSMPTRQWARRNDGALRAATIGLIADLKAAVTDFEAVRNLVDWHFPTSTDGEPGLALAIWTEATALGVLAGGACSSFGTALVNLDQEALARACQELLPPAASTASFGSDLTVMVAGTPTAAISSLLDLCADRESRGTASIWRFREASIRRAMDGGLTAADLTKQLSEIANGALPQTLSYLIGDVARRHGQVVAVPALCCLRSEDQALLTEICAHRSLVKLGLRLVAPTVAISSVGVADTLAALRSAGYLPVAEQNADVMTISTTRANDRHTGVGPAPRARAGRARLAAPRSARDGSIETNRTRGQSLADMLLDGAGPTIW